MRFLNVMAIKEFLNNGENVVLWHKIGVIKQINNNMWYLQLFHQPETDFYIFGDKEKVENLVDFPI